VSYREENGQVILTMSRTDFDMLLMMLGAGAGILGIKESLLFVNRLNEGNPHFIPYEVSA
jgi:hypothetical protein